MTNAIWRRELGRAVALGSITAVGIASGHRLWVNLAAKPFLDPRIERIGHSRSGIARQTPVGIEGSEVLVVLIGSSRCVASRQPMLVTALKTLRTRIVDIAANRSVQVSFVGVALDDIVVDGLKWLTAVGPFDEIGVGRNWLNSYMIHLVHRELRGDAAVPQLIFLRRVVSANRAGMVFVGADEVLLREVGLDNIVELASTDRSITRGLGIEVGAARE